MTDTTFCSPYGTFELQRRPLVPQLPLQAWDAADEYLLSLCQHNNANEQRVLLINDQFGALAVALHRRPIDSWSDSFTAHRAARENLLRNACDISHFTTIPVTKKPAGPFALILWRIPKSLALLKQQAAALQTLATANTMLLAGSMLKHLPPQTRDWLSLLGNVDTLPAQKKARVFSLTIDPARSPIAVDTETTLYLPEHNLRLYAGANVFARDKFDIGARFFLEQFAQLPPAQHIADLGCGNGVLGLMAKRKYPAAHIEFFDESYQAVAAAKRNYRENGFDPIAPVANFHVDDVFENYRGDLFDLILCNPPFHQGHVIGDHIARQMFVQSRNRLRSGGELWIVGNRHLQYPLKLKKIFGNCRQVAANAKFVVLAARK